MPAVVFECYGTDIPFVGAVVGDVPAAAGAQFGDLLLTDDHRHVGTFIVGKENALLPNPDYSGSGHLTIPFEITQYLTDATRKYESDEIEYTHIDLRPDDQFITDTFGMGSVPADSPFRFTWLPDQYEVYVLFPNGHEQNFQVGSSRGDVLAAYSGSLPPSEADAL